MNKGISTALSAIGIAQGLKIVTNRWKTGKWDWRSIFQTGGMPSSHSAGVSSIAAYVAANRGTRHTETALAVVFGSIVMYDAQGLRRHTGEIAKLVNELEDNVEEISKTTSIEYFNQNEELNELLGHQPAEVLFGSLFGILYGWSIAKYEDHLQNK
ncbi:divergent PAP2 family protein [Halobacillus rhizosphaerae]|uniref:divergent PAP2 family protein n=1 Tax=Halobacillus rhizosphaerae TaxID=3064889 RepID=UPI00398AE978